MLNHSIGLKRNELTMLNNRQLKLAKIDAKSSRMGSTLYLKYIIITL